MSIRWGLETSFSLVTVVHPGNFPHRCFPQEKPTRFLKDLLPEVIRKTKILAEQRVDGNGCFGELLNSRSPQHLQN